MSISIGSSGGSHSEQMRRIDIDIGLTCVWRQKCVSLVTKMRLYMSLVVPVLLYASETCTVNKEDLGRLQAFNMRCKRQILEVHWYDMVRNSDISRRSKLSHIGDLIQQRRHCFFGHVVRMHVLAPAHVSLKLCRDFSLSRCVPPGCKRPRVVPV